MAMILALYLGVVWLVFAKFKLVRWGWFSGSMVVAGGAVIAGVFLAFFNYLTPTGRFVVGARVVEITPNVAGQIVAVSVKPNTPVQAGAVLLQIDPTPYQHKVRQLEASLVGAQKQALQLADNFNQATANVEGLTKGLEYHTRRLEDMQRLIRTGASTPFREQDIRDQVDTTTYQLAAAKAAQQGARHALDAEVDGVNTTVAGVQAQLANAKWELEQTTVRAPADGFVSAMGLAVGDRAVTARSLMSFIVADEITIVGMFSPNGFDTIRPGARVSLVFDSMPGRIFETRVQDIPRGVGQGQIAVSGMLARTDTIRGAGSYPAVISIPGGLDRQHLHLGMPGTATVYSQSAGVIGLVRSILVWISSYTAYL